VIAISRTWAYRNPWAGLRLAPLGSLLVDPKRLRQPREVHRHPPGLLSGEHCGLAGGLLVVAGLSTNGLWERNYTHHNDGPAITFGGSPPAEPWGPNTFRLNVSEEDNLQGTDGGGIWALNPTSSGYVYNNTAYRSLGVSGAFPFCISLGYNGTYGGGLIANNTCTNAVILWGGIREACRTIATIGPRSKS
jgi:hypothetical protein